MRRAAAENVSEARTPTAVAMSALITSSRADASEKLIAMSRPTPRANRIAAPAPAFTITPPEVIGITPAAAARQITARAVVGLKDSPRALRSAALPNARDDQQAKR